MNPLAVAASKPVRICPLLPSDDARLQTQLRVDYADIERTVNGQICLRTRGDQCRTADARRCQAKEGG